MSVSFALSRTNVEVRVISSSNFIVSYPLFLAFVTACFNSYSLEHSFERMYNFSSFDVAVLVTPPYSLIKMQRNFQFSISSVTVNSSHIR